MRTVEIPQPPKGAEMGAFEAVRAVVCLSSEVLKAHRILDAYLSGKTTFDGNAAGMVFAVEAHLRSALERIEQLKGDE